jgi:hypothetical protein
LAYLSTPHSIIFSVGSALIFQRKFFSRTMKNRLPDPSKICALEFKREFRRFKVCSGSATIDNDRSIFHLINPAAHFAPAREIPSATKARMIIIFRQRRPGLSKSG